MSLHGFKHTLAWSKDFTTKNAPPPGKEDLAAFTVATAGTFGGLKAYKNSDDDLYYFKHSSVKVEIKMVKSECWVLKDSKTDKLLRHEQLHYNISALGGRDLERELKNASAESPAALVEMRDSITQQIQDLIDEINKEYDNRILWGTDHGRIDLHQEVWEHHVNKLMNNGDAKLESIYAMMKR